MRKDELGGGWGYFRKEGMGFGVVMKWRVMEPTYCESDVVETGIQFFRVNFKIHPCNFSILSFEGFNFDN